MSESRFIIQASGVGGGQAIENERTGHSGGDIGTGAGLATAAAGFTGIG